MEWGEYCILLGKIGYFFIVFHQKGRFPKGLVLFPEE
jgi:hypothetical protein